jgi:hypothetical protein
MKKILDWLKHWFEHNGLIKLVSAFTILILSVVLGRHFVEYEKFFTWTALISGGYVVLTAFIFTIAGIVNAIKDAVKNKKG